MNQMRFNKAKCKVLHLCQGNPRYVCRLVEELTGSTLAEKDLNIPVDEKQNMSLQCAHVAQKANCIRGCNKTGVASRARKVIISTCSALIKPHLEHGVLDPYKKNVELLEETDEDD